MAEDKVQQQRFELKYRVSAQTALEIRDFVSAYLEPDEYSVGKPNYSYPIHSLYLDSDDLRLYWDVINSNKNRYKLRLRYYDDDPASPVFPEIKRRVNDAILKQRCAVRREAIPRLLAGQLPDPEHMLSNKPQHVAAVQEFCRRMLDLRASPKTHVAYLREAWVTPDSNAVRVCLDRQICSVPQLTPELTTHMENPVMPFEPDVILELKFTGRFPNWFRTLTETFGLTQCSAAKYADGVAEIEERQHYDPGLESTPPLAPETLRLNREDLLERYLERRRRLRNQAGSR